MLLHPVLFHLAEGAVADDRDLVGTQGRKYLRGTRREYLHPAEVVLRQFLLEGAANLLGTIYSSSLAASFSVKAVIGSVSAKSLRLEVASCPARSRQYNAHSSAATEPDS